MNKSNRPRGLRADEIMGLTVDKAATWELMSSRLYGSNVDRLALGVREALQNSRDAIRAAYKRGIRTKDDGKFTVSWGRSFIESRGTEEYWIRFTDNGIGMTSDIVRSGFLCLGGTTKGIGDQGGFGIAKAAILSLSRSFRWTIHTGYSLYTADGDIEHIKKTTIPTFHQGVDLILYDVIPTAFSFGYELPLERVQRVLGANDLAPRGSYPGIRVYAQDEEIVTTFYQGGIKLVTNHNITPDIKIDIVVYRRNSGSTGAMYVRLAGLFQFKRSLYSLDAMDLVVDITTKLASRAEDYPLPMNRNELTGSTDDFVDGVIEKLRIDKESSLHTDTEIQLLGIDLGELEDIVEQRRLATERMEELLNDPDVRARMLQVQSGGDVLRRLQNTLYVTRESYASARKELIRQNQDREHSARDDWHNQSRQADQTKKVRPEPQPAQSGGIDLKALARLQPKEKKKRGRPPAELMNPFVGFAYVKINRQHFNATRLRPYYANPQKWIDVILAWRFACQMVLEHLGESYRNFEVGFIFDDKTNAAYLRENHKEILLINPEWFSKTILKAFKDRPLNVAAVLHSKAAHEVTHLLGYHEHDERFMIRREQVADETAGVLYPMAAMVSVMLRLKPTHTRGPKPKGERAVDMVQLRRQLCPIPGHVGCATCN